ncbi:peptidylprolyl isomerase [Mesosutterella sp. AGMB02718]|uniref:peptidylprolyl isomerase n=1 Tax=Mesosutterella faecium TaxID=2925194 RepID=A0ABT7IN36_9BURK|nr:peptidylprolyl isomerase [Mesosutterella sp. AGMB02718]MDL2059785.1 peptidylprolyl isomerase [Mesosutterella sp. AGMB02718]
MNFNLLVPAIIAVAAACGTASAAVKDFTVNGVRVTAAEQEQLIKNAVAHGQKRSPQLEDAVKRNLIARRVLSSEAKKTGVDKQPQVTAALESAREQILSDAYIASYLKKNPVTNEEIKAAYDQQKSHYGSTEYRLNHIAVKTQDDANKAAGRISKGEAFSKVARSVSLDPTVSRNGGDMGWINSGSLPPQMVEKLSQIKGSQTLVVTGPAGFEVIQNKGTRKAKPFPSLDKAKPEIRSALEGQKASRHIADLVKKAEIK